jgi:MoaA/NifB/PqqE/SkfB family radical SAM enzyme
MLTEATRLNLERKATYADHLQLLPDGTPLFSWLDISPTELCNRSAGSPKACVFCPRIDPAFYPNQNIHMSLDLAGKVAEELHVLRYEGAVVFCGFGEPLLHPDFVELVKPFKGLHVEIVTNGDRLRPSVIDALYEAVEPVFVVSCYDGPHQIGKFKEMFGAAYLPPDVQYVLRDRWYDESADYGLKLTNRAGTIHAGHQRAADTHARCFYPSYAVALDWNGDFLLCVQDWNKRLRFGNVGSQSLVECWKGTAFNKRRMQLLRGDRSGAPCNSCNAEGCAHGQAHAQAWGVNV